MGLTQGVVGRAEDAAEGAGIQGAEEEVEVSSLVKQTANIECHKNIHVLAWAS